MTAWVQSVDKPGVSFIATFHTEFMHRPYTYSPALAEGIFSLRLNRLASYPKFSAMPTTTTISDKK